VLTWRRSRAFIVDAAEARPARLAETMARLLGGGGARDGDATDVYDDVP